MKAAKEDFITLYHGTTLENGLNLIKYGWEPNRYSNNIISNYLYLTSDYDDALWYANEKGGKTVIEISNIPIEYLQPDPVNEVGYNMTNLIHRIKKGNKPSKFILTEQLNCDFFNIFEK